MKFPCCFPLALLVLSGILLTAGFSGHAAEKKDARLCEINSGPCLQKVGYADVSLAITPRPVKALEELALTVNVQGMKTPRTLLIDFSMPGMSMGKNQAVLTRTGPGTFTGKGIIPKCPSGRSLWRASVIIPDAGNADFLFHVLY